MVRRRGRARKSGPRYSDGHLKPPPSAGADPIAPALWQRLAAEAKKKTIDERLGTELGRLFLHTELTSAQVAAGFRVARVYRTFERFKGKRRTPASPGYEGGRGDHSIAEELMTDEALAELEDNIHDAEKRFEALEKWFVDERMPRHVKNALQELCVEDKMVGPVLVAELRPWLDRLGGYFGFAAAAKPKPKTEQVRKLAEREPNIDRSAWMAVVGKLCPRLSHDALGKAYEVQRALVARAVFRRSKEKRGDNVVELSMRGRSASHPG